MTSTSNNGWRRVWLSRLLRLITHPDPSRRWRDEHGCLVDPRGRRWLLEFKHGAKMKPADEQP